MSYEDSSDRATAGPGLLRRIRATLPVLLGTLAVLSVGGAVAVAAGSGSGGTITGCILTDTGTNEFDQTVGRLRVLDQTVANDHSCSTDEETTTWNQVGPQGATGPQGPQGPAGATGTPGVTGPAGPQGATPTVSAQTGAGTDVFMILSPPNDLGKLGPTPQGEALSNNAGSQVFDLSSFSLDTSNTTSIGSASTGAGAGKVRFEKFQFVKLLDKYSSVLFQDLAAGRVIKEAEIIVRKPSAKGKDLPVVQYMLKNVVLTDLHVSGESRAPSETIQGLYGSIQFVVYEQSPTGTVKPGPSGGWNQITNSPVTSLKRIG
jgi:type VI protein secretion system component Hcp